MIELELDADFGAPVVWLVIDEIDSGTYGVFATEELAEAHSLRMRGHGAQTRVEREPVRSDLEVF